MATETLRPGQRLVLRLPLSHHDAVTIAVLDSATQPDAISCAAMLVPAGEERNWIYASEGGQWQLLATAAVARLIIVSRTNSATPPAHDGSEAPNPNPNPNPMCLRCEDEALKTRLRSIVVALAPRICFRNGPPFVPFVLYSDNVIHRVVVEELFSSVTGSMVVEDVALDDSDGEVLEFGGRECEHKVGNRRWRDLVYRRRLRFKRMPNLVQTEVALVVGQNVGEQVMSGLEIDDGWLVHKYLPPIVAGLVLAASCIEPCMERGEKPKVVALGVGGGALPIFLQKHLGFRVQAVDVDEVVLEAAHRHFGLVNGVDMEVIVGDALQFIDKLAVNARAKNTALNPLNSSSEESPGFRNSTNVEGEDGLGLAICRVNGSERVFDNNRVHAIIVDVDEGDPRCGLSSPPSSFLEHKFLTDARAVLHEGGVLAMNVVPNGAKAYHGVVSSLFSVFNDVYETVVEGDVNRVVFALSSRGASVNLDGPLARLVKRFLDVRLITGIQRVCIEA